MLSTFSVQRALLLPILYNERPGEVKRKTPAKEILRRGQTADKPRNRRIVNRLRHDCAEARSCLFLTGNEWGYSAGMSRIRAMGVPASVKFSVKVAVSSFTVKSSGVSTLSSSSRARVEPVSTSAGSEI